MGANVTNSEESISGRRRSIWIDSTPETSYEALEDGVSVDTAVIGGGIAGLTTAHELKEAGQSVAVVERDRIVTGVTGHTTAKLTSLHGLIYTHLLEYFGMERARQYAEANQAAIDRIEETVESHDIDCDFERTSAYTYTESLEQSNRIREEAKIAGRLGLPASYTESTSLPFDIEAAVTLDEQARFHPRKYLLAIARRIAGEDSFVLERTTAEDIRDGEPCLVTTDRGVIRATDVVVATHFPFFDHALYFTRLTPKRSYVIAARLDGEVPDGMYYGSGEPYFSVRPRPTGDEQLVLLGGQNHRTGHGGSTKERYRKLERQVHDRFDVESIAYRWATQDYVSVDRVPFVGKHAPHLDHVYVATGFGGWGMTNGTVAGMLLSDLILDSDSPWQDVYRPTRMEFAASKKRLLSHNKHAMRHFIEGTFANYPKYALGSIDPGQATIVDSEDGPVGVHRDGDDHLHAVSVRCTHQGCVLEWNDGDTSWDCPCHGSRFDVDGTVLDTPAVEDLSAYDEDELDSLGLR